MKFQGLETTWQRHSIQALIYMKCQGPEATWQHHSIQALVEATAKCQGLEATWQRHSIQALVEFVTKCQRVQAFWSIYVQELYRHFIPLIAMNMDLCHTIQIVDRLLDV